MLAGQLDWEKTSILGLLRDPISKEYGTELEQDMGICSTCTLTCTPLRVVFPPAQWLHLKLLFQPEIASLQLLTSFSGSHLAGLLHPSESTSC